jgi:hypothetical protein
MEWQFPNILADGEYYIDPAILHSDGITISDWWNEAKKMKISKDRHLPYKIDPDFKISVKND